MAVRPLEGKTKGAKKRGKGSIVQRWTEEYCRFLDHLATWKVRSRYENSLVLKLKMENIKGGETKGHSMKNCD